MNLTGCPAGLESLKSLKSLEKGLLQKSSLKKLEKDVILDFSGLKKLDLFLKVQI